MVPAGWDFRKGGRMLTRALSGEPDSSHLYESLPAPRPSRKPRERTGSSGWLRERAGTRTPTAPKGPKIAQRLSFGATLPEMTKPDQTAWIERLWKERNNAIHEGRDFEDDLNVDRLLDLIREVLLALASHLARNHRSGRAVPCRTWRETMNCIGVPV